MNTIDELIRESEEYLVSAVLAMKPYKEISDYQSIFESSDPEIIAQEEANNDASEKSQGFLKKTLETLKKAFKALISKIKDFIDRITMSNAERVGLKKMEEMMRQNPEFANKKISVKEYRKIVQLHEQKLKDIEAKIKEVRANEQTPIDKFVDDTKDFLAGNLSGTAVIVTCDTARKMAVNNVEVAIAISKMLDYGVLRIEDLEKQLGKKEAKKFAKDMHKYSKESVLRNLYLRVAKKEYDYVGDAFKDTMKEMVAAATLGVGHKGRSLKDNEYTSKTIKATKKGLFSAAGSVIKGGLGGVKDGIKSGKDDARAKAAREGKKKAIDDFLS